MNRDKFLPPKYSESGLPSPAVSMSQPKSSLFTISYHPPKAYFGIILALVMAMGWLYFPTRAAYQCIDSSSFWRCFVKREYIFAVFLGVLSFWVMFELIFQRSQFSVLDKEHNVFRCKWEGVFGTKLGKKVVECPLTEVISVQVGVQRGRRGRRDKFGIYLWSRHGARVQIVGFMLSRKDAVRKSERLSKFLGLVTPIVLE